MLDRKGDNWVIFMSNDLLKKQPGLTPRYQTRTEISIDVSNRTITHVDLHTYIGAVVIVW